MRTSRADGAHQVLSTKVTALPNVLLDVIVELQGWQTKRGQHLADVRHLTGRAEPVAPPTVEVGRAAKVGTQLAHEPVVLAGQHLLLHLREPFAEDLRLGAAVVFALFRLACPLRVDHTEKPVILRNHLQGNMAQAMCGHGAVAHRAVLIQVGYVLCCYFVHHHHQFLDFCLQKYKIKGETQGVNEIY